MSHPTIEALRIARDAAREGRKREAGRVLDEVAPDFEYLRRSRTSRATGSPVSIASLDAVLRAAYTPNYALEVAMRPHPLFSALKKSTTLLPKG